jgi:hypothetical protein
MTPARCRSLSVSVVLPASTWARMPRLSERAGTRDPLRVATEELGVRACCSHLRAVSSDQWPGLPVSVTIRRATRRSPTLCLRASSGIGKQSRLRRRRLGVVIDLKVDGERSHDEFAGHEELSPALHPCDAKGQGQRRPINEVENHKKRPCGSLDLMAGEGWRRVSWRSPLGPLAPDRPQARRAASKSRKNSPTRPPLGGAAACRGGVRP